MIEIRSRLETAVQPVLMDLLDEGHLHAGHEGAKDGRGHFRLRIVSDHFAGLAMLQRHRMVYELMGELMATDIHALSIDALTPNENQPVQSGDL